MQYTPPTPEQLERLKQELNLSSAQMAELFGVQGGRQWRKYTGGETPRELSPHILFFAAARLTLTPGELELVLGKMRDVGARIELDAPSDSRAPDGEQQP